MVILGIHVTRSFVPRSWIRTQESNYQITLSSTPCMFVQLRVIASPKGISAELRVIHYKHPPASPGSRYFPLYIYAVYAYILGYAFNCSLLLNSNTSSLIMATLLRRSGNPRQLETCLRSSRVLEIYGGIRNIQQIRGISIQSLDEKKGSTYNSIYT